MWHHSSRTRFILPVFLSKISLKSGIHTIFSKLLRVQKGKKIYWFEFKTVMGSSDEPYTFWFFILLFYSSNKFVFCLWNMQLWTFDVWFLYQIIDLVFWQISVLFCWDFQQHSNCSITICHCPRQCVSLQVFPNYYQSD